MSKVENVNGKLEQENSTFNLSSSSITPKWYSWNRFSEQSLKDAEAEIFEDIGLEYKAEYIDLGVNISNPDIVYSISLNTESTNTPLVLLHGLGGGVGIWCCNLKAFSKDRPVYAIDLVGFGRSSRSDFSINSSYIEHQHVKVIEKYREVKKLERFILLGHSLGGYLGTAYALKYPERVKHLILADPWGFSIKPAVIPYKSTIDYYIDYILSLLNPYAPIRLVGPFGEWLLKYARPQLIQKFSDAFSKGHLMVQYLYHINAQYPSGERAFWYMSNGFPWCKFPMIKRLNNLDENVSITHIVGSETTVDRDLAKYLQQTRENSYFKTYTVQGAGHHIYIDHVEEFNKYVLEACAYSDQQKDIPSK